MCCSDGIHCCPAHYKCDPQAGSCVSGDAVMSWFRKLPATLQIGPDHQDVKCDDQTSCEDGQTCCRMSPSTWGCCPFPQVHPSPHICQLCVTERHTGWCSPALAQTSSATFYSPPGGCGPQHLPFFPSLVLSKGGLLQRHEALLPHRLHLHRRTVFHEQRRPSLVQLEHKESQAAHLTGSAPTAVPKIPTLEHSDHWPGYLTGYPVYSN